MACNPRRIFILKTSVRFTRSFTKRIEIKEHVIKMKLSHDIGFKTVEEIIYVFRASIAF